MIARARTAKTSQKVNDMLTSMTGTTSMDAFERMKEKVEMLESKAEVRSLMLPLAICLCAWLHLTCRWLVGLTILLCL